MNLDKMNEVTWLNVNLKGNNIEDVELKEWLEWSGNKLDELSLNLNENRIESGYNDNMEL